MKSISRVPQKLFRYFDGTIVSTFFVPLLPVLPVIFPLISNESEISLAALKSVYPYNIAIKFQMFLNNYHYIL